MKYIIHKFHVISVLTTEQSFNNYKLKGQNCSIESQNVATHVIEAGIYITYFKQLLGLVFKNNEDLYACNQKVINYL